jgi:hypothetical protein
MDAPIIGQLFVRNFDDPNIKPLDLTVNDVPRSGVNWVQMAEDTSTKGITEGRTVILYPKGTNGKVYIKGCGANIKSDFNRIFIFNIKDVYPIDKDCMIDILVNSTDYVKEEASLFVAVYKKTGGFLATPIAYRGRYGKQCFEFQDPYVGYTVVNGRRTSDSSGCGFPADSYLVQGITSKGRIFYGKYERGGWVWIK